MKEQNIEQGTGIKLKELLSEYEDAVSSSLSVNSVALDERRRLMVWDRQSEDGRKWDDDSENGEVLPWNGAADTRVPLIDEVIQERVAVRCAAARRAQVQVSGVELGDAEATAAVRRALIWLTSGKLRRRLNIERQLAGNYTDEFGWCVVYVGWCRQLTKYRRDITLEMLAQWCAQLPPDNPLSQLPVMIQDPSQEESAIAVLQGLYAMYAKQETTGLHQLELPDLTKAAARKMIVELQKDGRTSIVLPKVAVNEPRPIALRPYVDVLLARGSTDVESARAIFWRQMLTEADIKDLALAEDWDQAWVEETVKQKGKSEALDLSSSAKSGGLDKNLNLFADDKRVEVVYGFRRTVDEDDVPQIWCTVFCPQVKGPGKEDLVAKHVLIDYGHGRYPFIDMSREHRNRNIHESRSVPGVAYTWQLEEKAQRDALFNRSEWDTLPPIEVTRLMGVKVRLGPAALVPTSRAQGIKAIELSNRPPSLGLEMIRLIQQRTDNYFGRPSNDVPAYRAQIMQELMVADFLDDWSIILMMMLALQVQYDPQKLTRVLGRPWPPNLTPETIIEQVDVLMAFDTKEIDPEFLLKKMDIISQSVIPEDTAGVIDRAKLTAAKLRWLDPALADDLVQNQEGAQAKMWNQVMQTIGMAALGNEAQYTQNDPTAQTKLQYVQQIVTANPKYQMLLQKDPDFQDLMKKYVANLMQSINQQENKMVGRIGVKPRQMAQI
jgi:hypothetical protein